MSLLNYLKSYRDDVINKRELYKRNMFNIKEDTLYFFGSTILDFQMNRISLCELESMFNVFGFCLLNEVQYGSNYFLVCDSNGQEYDIYINDEMFEFLAIRGNEEAKRCMKVILDWERDFGYSNHKNWVNVDRKWVLNPKFGKKSII